MLTTLVLAGFLLAQPETGSDADLATQVRKLSRQLDAGELSAREEAEEKLIKLGPSALPLLPADLEKITSAEIKQRLVRVRQQLERDQAELTAQATLLTLPAGDMPLTKFLAALEKQTGNKIVDMRSKLGQEIKAPTVKVDFQKVPFWRALDQVLDEASMVPYHYGGDGALAIIARTDENASRQNRGVYSGPFRIEPTQIYAKRDLRSPLHSLLQITLEIAWEPRLTPINIEHPLDEVVWVDDAGHKNKFSDPTAEPVAEVQPGTTAVELSLPLPLPSRAVKKISSLKGKVVALTPGPVEVFTFDKLAESKKQQISKTDCTVFVDEVKKNNDVWEVQMRVRFDKAKGALESHRGWVFANEAYMLDASGTKIVNSGMESTSQSEDEVGVAYVFDLKDGPAGHKFVYKTPASIHKITLDYELKDLELP